MVDGCESREEKRGNKPGHEGFMTKLSQARKVLKGGGAIRGELTTLVPMQGKRERSFS